MDIISGEELRKTAAFALAGLVSLGADMPGNVSRSGKYNSSDAVKFQSWLLGDKMITEDPDMMDLSGDGRLDVVDLCLMKERILEQALSNDDTNKVYVKNTEELKNALADAKPGDEIILAEGEYVYSGVTPKGHMFTGEANGTSEAPIILRSENPEKPSVLSGTDTKSNYGLTITGDWWIIKDITVTNAGKGIILDNSNHTSIVGCEVYNIGTEGIHFRDNSSWCIAENCYVHDTGVVTPSYGEAIYVGSSRTTTGYGYSCDYNTIRNCRLGPGVTAEHIDIKEYTTGTLVEGCTFNGGGMSGENYADSFVDIKGNDCIVRNNFAYRNGCEKIKRAFEMNRLEEGWGQNAFIYGNRAFMDTAKNSADGKMYFLNAWNCSATVWNNYMSYESGELFSVDHEEDHWKYYNCNKLTYGDSSYEEKMER